MWHCAQCGNGLRREIGGSEAEHNGVERLGWDRGPPCEAVTMCSSVSEAPSAITSFLLSSSRTKCGTAPSVAMACTISSPCRSLRAVREMCAPRYLAGLVSTHG